jgi:4-amino-4-deoxy-L-arabinose transferase-like glycosyltransferase
MSTNNKIRLGIVVFSLMLFIPYLGDVHLFDWDEINFAEAAREMVITGNYSVVQIDYKAFFEKPPLFFWMQAISMHIFGINEFAARFPNALVGVFSLLLIFNIGRRYYDSKFGLIWVLSYAGSILPFFYFKSGIIDPWFNFFIFLGVYYASRYLDETSINSKKNLQSVEYNLKQTPSGKNEKLDTGGIDERNKWNLVWSGAAIGLGILTKGPVALLLILLTLGVYFLIKRFKGFPSVLDFIIFFGVVLLFGGSWFIVEFVRGNEAVVYEFIKVQVDLLSKNVADHEQPWYYHSVVLFIGVFPAAILAIKSFGKSMSDNKKQQHLSLFMQILFWVVLIVFSSVKTKIVHYSSMTYFSLTFLAAHTVYYLLSERIKWSRWMTVALSLVGFIWSFLMLMLPVVGMNTDKLRNSSLIGDKFAKANMEAIVNWTGFEGIIGLLLLMTIVFVLFNKTLNAGIRMLILNVVVMITMFVFTAVNVPKIEKYTQNAAIEFFQKFNDDSAYVAPLKYRSYAYLFYSDKQPQQNPNHNNFDWLLNGDIDKPAYFISRITQKEDVLKAHKNLEVIGKKNGFVFYKRIDK